MIVHPLGTDQVYEEALATDVILYVTLLPAHGEAFPEIAPGVAGVATTVTASVFGGLAPHALCAVTLILPPVVPAFTVADMDVGVLFLKLHPAGIVQV